MKHLFVLFAVLSLFSFTSKAQDDIVRDNLLLLAHGKIDEVKAKIPDLLAKYPNDPGIKLLHGAILDDGSVAVEMYKNIIEKHADSQWADDAYWRMVQYYAISGDLEKANNALENFRRRYPASPFVAPASDVVFTVSKMMKKGNAEPQQIVKEKKSESEKTMAEQNTEEHKKIPDDMQKKDFARPRDNDIKTPNDDTKELNKNTEDNAEELTSEDEAGTVVKSEPTEESITDDYEGFYGLQVGIYKDQESAESEKEKFLSKRLRTSVSEKDVEGKTMYAVVIGHYSSLQSAEAAKILVRRQCGCDPIIYKKDAEE